MESMICTSRAKVAWAAEVAQRLQAKGDSEVIQAAQAGCAELTVWYSFPDLDFAQL